MGRFAESTTVPVERSRAEIESLVIRHHASEFTSGWKQGAAMIAFRIKNLLVRFILPFPARNERRFTHRMVRGYEKRVSEAAAAKAYEQDVRSRWRALHLVIKAKLEAVEVGISTIEDEFLSHIVLASDITLGQWLIDTAMPAIRDGRMPQLLLPGPAASSENNEVQDAEIVHG